MRPSAHAYPAITIETIAITCALYHHRIDQRDYVLLELAWRTLRRCCPPRRRARRRSAKESGRVKAQEKLQLVLGGLLRRLRVRARRQERRRRLNGPAREGHLDFPILDRQCGIRYV